MTTLNAYLTKYSILKGTDLHAESHDRLADGLWVTPHDYSNDPDYLLVGTAEVQITLMPRADVVNTQVVALRRQAENIKAEAGVAVMRIEQQINSLLAIEGAATEV